MKTARLCMLVVLTVLGTSPVAVAQEPTLRFRAECATWIGGSQWEQPREIIVLNDGSVLVGGQTSSADLPVTEGAAQTTYGGEPAGTGHPGVVGGDCFVAKLNRDFSKLVWCTYFGGSKQERATYGFNLHPDGDIIVCTACRSHDAPTTEGSCQPKYGGGRSDTLVGKLRSDGKKFTWCTYVGGRGEDWPRGGTALDGKGNVVIVGRSTSPDFPATPGVIRSKVTDRKGDAMIVKLSADGKRLVWATLLGGSNWDGLMGARVDKAGNVYVAGHTQSKDLPVTPGAPQRKAGGKADLWLTSMSPDGKKIRYCTYLAGSENEFAEHRPALLDDGSVLLTGFTGSKDFPTTAGAYQRTLKGKGDAFLAKLSPDGRRFEFVTLIGGHGKRGEEFLLFPTVGPAGNIYAVGATTSRDFPVTEGALQKTFGGGKGDAVLVVMSPDGKRLVYSTYLGGRGDDLLRGIAVTKTGVVYLAGNSNSDNLPFISPNAAQKKRKGQHDGIILKLVPTVVHAD